MEKEKEIKSERAKKEEIYEEIFGELKGNFSVRVTDKIEEYISGQKPIVNQACYLDILANEVAENVYKEYKYQLRRRRRL